MLRGRFIVAATFLLLSGCGPGLVFNSSEMSAKEMMARASHIFVGVIQKQQLESWPFLRFSFPDMSPATAKCWKVLRREVRVEMVLRGAESRKVINVYSFSGLVVRRGTGTPRMTGACVVPCPRRERTLPRRP